MAEIVLTAREVREMWQASGHNAQMLGVTVLHRMAEAGVEDMPTIGDAADSALDWATGLALMFAIEAAHQYAKRHNAVPGVWKIEVTQIGAAVYWRRKSGGWARVLQV